MGDTNCEFQIRTNIPSIVKNLEDLNRLFGYFQIIEEATRVIPTTSTLTDHFVVTNKHNILKSEVIKTIFRDHYAVYRSGNFKGRKQSHKPISCRKMKNFSRRKFLERFIQHAIG